MEVTVRGLKGGIQGAGHILLFDLGLDIWVLILNTRWAKRGLGHFSRYIISSLLLDISIPISIRVYVISSFVEQLCARFGGYNETKTQSLSQGEPHGDDHSWKAITTWMWFLPNRKLRIWKLIKELKRRPEGERWEGKGLPGERAPGKGYWGVGRARQGLADPKRLQSEQASKGISEMNFLGTKICIQRSSLG